MIDRMLFINCQGITQSPMEKVIDLSFPNMGWSKYPFLSLYRRIKGVNVINPPPVNSSIIETGVKISPEFVCFPFKVTIGEIINLIQNLKIKNIIYPIDKGPCRMGFYAHVQDIIMKDMGLDFNLITLQQDSLFPEKDWLNSFKELERLTGKKIRNLRIMKNVIRFLLKAKIIEDLTKISCVVRCREQRKGDTNKVVNHILRMLDATENISSLLRFGSYMKAQFREIPIKRDIQPLRVIISGEIHVLLEHYVNFDIMRKLGDYGIEVHPTFGVYDWLLHKMHINARRRKLEEIARQFIPLDIGGEAQWDIGAYIEAQKNGFDGMVLVYPFTCMPETTVRSIIEGMNPDPFYMPSLYFSFDESSAFEGMRTRIEAFIDIMNGNRKNNPKFSNRYEEPPLLEEIYGKKERFGGFKRFLNRFSNPVKIQKQLNEFRQIPKDLMIAFYLKSSPKIKAHYMF